MCWSPVENQSHNIEQAVDAKETPKLNSEHALKPPIVRPSVLATLHEDSIPHSGKIRRCRYHFISEPNHCVPEGDPLPNGEVGGVSVTRRRGERSRIPRRGADGSRRTPRRERTRSRRGACGRGDRSRRVAHDVLGGSRLER